LIAISIPLLFGTGDGSEFRRPLGLVIFAGVTTSALLTLFVIPCAFYFFEKKNFAAKALSERASGKTTFHEGNLALEGKGLDGNTLSPEMASD